MAIALVTGASRGIGKATALQLASEGYTVVVNFHHNIKAATDVINQIVDAGGKAFAVRADISDEAQVMAMFDSIDREGEPLAALVNNAGILFEQSTIENLSAERINRVLATNVTGYFLCCREAVKRMSHKHGGKGGAIVNVSSAASRLGAPGEYVDYAASKGAVDSLTTGLALEVAAQGIRVNGVRPGLIYTDIHASGGEPGRVDRVKSMLPMQRGGQPEEVAQAIVWLLSDKASYVTGSFLGAGWREVTLRRQPQPQAHSPAAGPAGGDRLHFTVRDHHQRWRNLNVPLTRQFSAGVVDRGHRRLLLPHPGFERRVIARAQRNRYHVTPVRGKRRHRRRGVAADAAPCRPDVDQQRSLLTHGDKIDGLTVEGVQCRRGEILRQRGLAEIVHRQAHGNANQQPHAQLAQQARKLTCHGRLPAVL